MSTYEQKLKENIDLQSETKTFVLDQMEKIGVTSHLKAQIKKHVLQILEKQNKSIKHKAEFDYLTPLHRLNKTKEIIVAYHIIKEFLQFFEMEYTLPIFENESNIKESVKRETLFKDLSLPDNREDPKPLLLTLISEHLDAVKNKRNNSNNEGVSNKLDDSYGTKSSYQNQTKDIVFKPDNVEEKKNELPQVFSGILNNNLPSGQNKKQLAPISFVNKSIEMEPSISQSCESLKFNTANINDLYKDKTDAEVETILNNPLTVLNTPENKEAIKAKKAEDKDNFVYTIDYSTNNNNKYDDEFTEVILEEINEDAHKMPEGEKKQDLEESKKSFGGSTSNLASLGYDCSITNYNLSEFDYYEDAEKV